MSTTADLVETFIRRMQNGEFVYDSNKALTITYSFQDGSTKTFVDGCTEALTLYQLKKDMKADTMREAAKAYAWVNRGFMLEIIKDGPALLKKLEQSEQEKQVLRSEIDGLSRKVVELETERRQFGKVEGELGSLEEKE